MRNRIILGLGLLFSLYLIGCKKDYSFRVVIYDNNDIQVIDTSKVLIRAHIPEHGEDFDKLEKAGFNIKNLSDGQTRTIYTNNIDYTVINDFQIFDTITNLKRGNEYEIEVFAIHKKAGEQKSPKYSFWTKPFLIDSITPLERRPNELFYVYGSGLDYFDDNTEIYFKVTNHTDSIKAKIAQRDLNKPCRFVTFYADSSIDNRYYNWIDTTYYREHYLTLMNWEHALHINYLTIRNRTYDYYNKIPFSYIKIYPNRPCIVKYEIFTEYNFIRVYGFFGNKNQARTLIIGDSICQPSNSFDYNMHHYYHNIVGFDCHLPNVPKGNYNMNVKLNGISVASPNKLVIK